MPIDINKHEVDIQNLKDQNVLDFEKDKIQAKQIEELKKDLSVFNNRNSVLINSLQQQIDNLQIVHNNTGSTNDIPTDLSLINGLLKLKKADGTTMGRGVIISTTQGEAVPIPNFSIGDVITLSPTSNATVTLTGTYPDLILNYGIPRGASGSGGSSGGSDIIFSDVSSNDIFVPAKNTTPTPTPTFSSISATYTQGDTVINTTTSLDSLKNNLVVTAHYSDSSSSVIRDYTLSGNLTVGTSTITVTYQGKTTTFNVTVSENSGSGGSEDETNLVLYIDKTLSQEATAENKTNIFVDHTNNHTVKAKSTNGTSSFVPKIISDDGTAIQFMNGAETGNLTVLNSGKLTSLNNTVEIYFESTADIGSTLISFYDNKGSSGQSLRVSNGRIIFGDGAYLYVEATTTIEPNTKYHLVVVSDFDNKKGYVYLNGVKLAEKVVNSFRTIEEHDVKLGQPSQTAIKYYYFKVYNKALTESEIQTLYGGIN